MCFLFFHLISVLRNIIINNYCIIIYKNVKTNNIISYFLFLHVTQCAIIYVNHMGKNL